MSINIREIHNVNSFPLEDLLPCPFCGMLPQIYGIKNDGFEIFTIRCENSQCSAVGDCEKCYCWIEESSKKSAIKRWNTRLVLFIGTTDYMIEKLK